MVTTVVPAASTSPGSADFTSTTPSMGVRDFGVVQAAIRKSPPARWLCSISALRATSSSSLRFNSRRLASAVWTAALRTGHIGSRAGDVFWTRTFLHQRSLFLGLTQHRAVRCRTWCAPGRSCWRGNIFVLEKFLHAVPIRSARIPAAPARRPRRLRPAGYPASGFHSAALRAWPVDWFNSALRAAMSLSSVAFWKAMDVSSCSIIGLRADKRWLHRAPSAGWSCTGSSVAIRSPCFTQAPSSTLRSVSRPAILNEMSTWVSSRFPDTKMRSPSIVIVRAPPVIAARGRGHQKQKDGESLFHRLHVFIGSQTPGFVPWRSQGRCGPRCSHTAPDQIVARAVQARLRVGHFDRICYARLIPPLALAPALFRRDRRLRAPSTLPSRQT